MTVITPPGFLQNAGNVHTAEILRSPFNTLVSGLITGGSMKTRGGVHPSVGTSYTTAQNGTPNMTVLVGSGVAFVPGTEGAKQGSYDVLNDGTVSLAITASNPSNPRYDLVILRVYDSFYSGASNTAALEIVTGTAAASPAEPATPANSFVLARVTVGAGVTSITNANILDRRIYITAVGGLIPVNTNTERDAIQGASSGISAINRTGGTIDYWTGSVWRPVGPAKLANLAAGSTQGWGLTEGLIADIADLDTLARYNGSQWMPLPGLNMVDNSRTAGDWSVAAGNHILLDTVTFTAVAGIRYMVRWEGRIATSNTANLAILHIRHASGGTLLTSSTSVVSRTFSHGVANQDVAVTLSKSFVATASGSYTCGTTINFFSGVGTMTVRSNANDESLLKVDVARQS